MYIFKYTYIFIFVDSFKNQHQKEQKRENKLKQNPLQYRNNLGEMNVGALLISDRLFHMVKLHRLIFASGCTFHWETTEL